MTLPLERAQHLLDKASARLDDLKTGFSPCALSLAEADEEVLYAEQLVYLAKCREQQRLGGG